MIIYRLSEHKVLKVHTERNLVHSGYQNTSIVFAERSNFTLIFTRPVSVAQSLRVESSGLLLFSSLSSNITIFHDSFLNSEDYLQFFRSHDVLLSVSSVRGWFFSLCGNFVPSFLVECLTPVGFLSFLDERGQRLVRSARLVGRYLSDFRKHFAVQFLTCKMWAFALRGGLSLHRRFFQPNREVLAVKAFRFHAEVRVF